MKKVLCVIFLFLFIFYGCVQQQNAPSNSSDEGSDSGTNIISTETEAATTYTYAFGEIEFSFWNDPNVGVAYIKCKDENIKLELVRDGTLIINGVSTDIEFSNIEFFQTIDNIILFATYQTDIYSASLYAFDITGTLHLEVYRLGDSKMRIKDIYIEDEKITLSGTRLHHGPSLWVENGSSIDLTDVEGNFLNIIGDDEEIEADYEMQYLGNNQFSPIIKIKTTLTYGEYKQQMNQS